MKVERKGLRQDSNESSASFSSESSTYHSKILTIEKIKREIRKPKYTAALDEIKEDMKVLTHNVNSVAESTHNLCELLNVINNTVERIR